MNHKFSKAVAFHEAGHAVARLSVGAIATLTEIRANGSGESHGTGLPWASSYGQYSVWNQLVVALAGAFAERLVSKRSITYLYCSSARGDYEEAQQLTEWLVQHHFSGTQHDAWVRAEEHTRDFVRSHRAAIERVAAALLKRGTLQPTEVINLALDP